jgi:hypothetical protein
VKALVVEGNMGNTEHSKCASQICTSYRHAAESNRRAQIDGDALVLLLVDRQYALVQERV